jgi:hypothetical protein
VWDLVTAVSRVRSATFHATTLDLGGERLQLVPRDYEDDLRLTTSSRALDLLVEATERSRNLAGRASTDCLAVFPTKEEVYLPTVGKPAPELLAVVAERLDHRGIPYLDLTPVFRARARAGDCLFFDVDGHPNRLGNEVIAEEVVRLLRAGYPG